MNGTLQSGDRPLPKGMLDQGFIVRNRAVLHVGLEGRQVERLTGDDTVSYILKYLPDETVLTGESWAYAKVLTQLPVIYPRLIAQSDQEGEERPWLLFEDVGTISHEAEEEVLIQIAEWMAIWHAVPLDSYPELLHAGQKPRLKQVVSDLLAQQTRIGNVFASLGFNGNEVHTFYQLLETFQLLQTEVYSHGDLHPGNYGRTSSGRVIVLDWEHNHRNTPMWDLYHLLDISHPLFPRTHNNQIRSKVLDTYLLYSKQLGNDYEEELFKREYQLFSVAFSLWMLLLIDRDIQDPTSIWPQDKLVTQREETLLSIRELLYILLVDHA
ncbi:phosphotransferase [Paenibacillus sp. PDC88]|uniref:phosphotransferase n=1 Tax=Paenibacillus sp. PDC88 TaxID=1884375 RepID=UPI0008992576|nr:phosphotransferase [Paenibacillus sp. PDC88]SDW66350.1 Phosphotransferase enzyme family protein [Paenibacillus sp. PDC88]